MRIGAYTIRRPNGRILKIHIHRITYPEFDGQATVFRARARLRDEEIDVGGETQREAVRKAFRQIFRD